MWKCIARGCTYVYTVRVITQHFSKWFSDFTPQKFSSIIKYIMRSIYIPTTVVFRFLLPFCFRFITYLRIYKAIHKSLLIENWKHTMYNLSTKQQAFIYFIWGNNSLLLFMIKLGKVFLENFLFLKEKFLILSIMDCHVLVLNKVESREKKKHKLLTWSFDLMDKGMKMIWGWKRQKVTLERINLKFILYFISRSSWLQQSSN